MNYDIHGPLRRMAAAKADTHVAPAAIDDEPVCGESYDHTLTLIAERDGWSTHECTECGAEITEGPEG